MCHGVAGLGDLVSIIRRFLSGRLILFFFLTALLEASVYHSQQVFIFQLLRQTSEYFPPYSCSIFSHSPIIHDIITFSSSAPDTVFLWLQFPGQEFPVCIVGGRGQRGGGGNTTTKKWLFRVETLNEKHSHGKVRCAHMYTRRATTTTTKVIIINLKSV